MASHLRLAQTSTLSAGCPHTVIEKRTSTRVAVQTVPAKISGGVQPESGDSVSILGHLTGTASLSPLRSTGDRGLQCLW